MEPLNLYLISQSHNPTWDTYDSAVVAAYSEDGARAIHPNGEFLSNRPLSCRYNAWARPEYVTVEYLGVAAANVKEGVICSSFNAG